MSTMRSGVLFCLLAIVAIGCHKVPYDDMMNAPQAVEIDDQTFTLDGGAGRDFFGDPGGSGSPLVVIVTLTGSDTTKPMPSTPWADHVWVIRSPYEVWEATLRPPSDTTSKYRIYYSATGGPKWPTGISVGVAALFRSGDGRTWLLRDPEVRISHSE